MYENEPNEFLYLTMNRETWDIPVSLLEQVWAEYHAWRNKYVGSGGSGSARPGADDPLPKRSV